MNRLRSEAQSLISGSETFRPATLRRSLNENYLYATDLPQAADAATAESFLSRAQRAGWKTKKENGWILMDPPAGKMEENPFEGPFGPEAKCCASLLNRHGSGREGKREQRMLLKAGEKGPEAFEKVCEQLHREWAAALRTGEVLPEIPVHCFTGGMRK